MNNLFRFASLTEEKNRTGAPKLVPIGNSSSPLSQNFITGDSLGAKTEGFIDVVDGFQWTSSPYSSKKDIPFALVKESRFKTNALVTQMGYYSVIISDKAGEFSGKLKNLIEGDADAKKISDYLQGTTVGQYAGQYGSKFFSGLGGYANQIIGSGLAQVFTGKSGADFLNMINFVTNSRSVLGSYEGLYLTEETGFIYKFPYFSDKSFNIATQFGTEDGFFSTNPLGEKGMGFAKSAETIASAAAAATNLTEPGVYIEKPKFYSYPSGGDAITISFPLINSGWSKFEDVQRNWQLLYMLVYQNSPNRKSRELIDPPCIYEVSVPGVKFMPFAHISQMNVQFMGARKRYNMFIPGLNNGSPIRIQTIVPDAYMVSITFTGLVPDTKNFLYHMLFEKQGKVNVISGDQGFATNSFNVIGQFLNSYNAQTGANAASQQNSTQGGSNQ